MPRKNAKSKRPVVRRTSPPRCSPFRVGDLVVSEFHTMETAVVRKITAITKDAEYESGFRASADCGCACEKCGRPFARPIERVDAAWFKKANPSVEGRP